MDIPLIELSDEQINYLKNMLNIEVATDLFTGEQMSIQKLFYYNELKRVSKIVEKILVQVFNIPVNYEILIEIFS